MVKVGARCRNIIMVAWRFLRRYLLLAFLMSGFVYVAIYFSTNEVFQAQVNLNPVRRHRQQAPVFPWDVKDALAEVPDAKKGHVVQRAVKVDETENVRSDSKAVEQKHEQKHEIKEPESNQEPVDFMTAQTEVQKERQRVLAETCSRHPELKKGNLNHFTYRHLYVHEKHKLLYCFVPKVGCSNWKRVLMVLSGKSKNIDGISSDEAHFKNGMKRLSELNKQEQTKRLETYTKFMFARHPFVRILSAYRNKYADIKVYRKDTYFHLFSKKIMKKYRRNASPMELKTGENITWQEWVTYLTDPGERSGFDDHWQEIYQMCSPCKIHYNYIGKLETVNDDAQFMLQSLELDDKVSYPAPSNSHPTNSSQTYDKFFGELTIDKLKKLWSVYTLDFELFGYPKPDFL